MVNLLLLLLLFNEIIKTNFVKNTFIIIVCIQLVRSIILKINIKIMNIIFTKQIFTLFSMNNNNIINIIIGILYLFNNFS